MRKDPYLKSQGVESTDIFFDMGIFVIFLAFLVFCFVVYYAAKLGAQKLSCCRKVFAMLKRYLFYQSPLRYMVVSYLRLLSIFSAMFVVGLQNELIGTDLTQIGESDAGIL